jgi:hypothetical protein
LEARAQFVKAGMASPVQGPDELLLLKGKNRCHLQQSSFRLRRVHKAARGPLVQSVAPVAFQP